MPELRNKLKKGAAPRKFAGGPLVVATHNAGKMAEFETLLRGRVEKLLSAVDVDLPEPVEDGASFLENATIKAVAGARASGLPCMADDSGLCVTALGGNPGIYSARWMGPEKDPMKAMRLVHERMGDATDRGAHFMAVLVLAWPDGHVEWAEGRVDGEIVWPPRGSGGHGYDPVFMPTGETRTFAQMSMDEKNAYSHRARALAALMETVF
ncbi:MAG: RdgB/HAM1 family non-canonical purine NTP pyrophosphatase [Rhodospirillales bacterium]|nr:RdgB/HAM1 family non-canonical purine NTP pyrophosphatase [Alphaproteobacteria bacterium]MCB9987212.1 RdgB/HAM1 family non-canonical purine NTP pyrophosphatase [Rhodospirillales bacterium]USO07926.1 MAG: RdgB/HAM1 family non-canonical purine NTP pyrophosphatase [Rhodospirillales bacterium]